VVSDLAEVPTEAITLTIPTLFRVPQLILSIPGRARPDRKKDLERPHFDRLSGNDPAPAFKCNLFPGRGFAAELTSTCHRRFAKAWLNIF